MAGKADQLETVFTRVPGKDKRALERIAKGEDRSVMSHVRRLIEKDIARDRANRRRRNSTEETA